MAEFGHSAAIVGGFCLDSWGSGPFVITDANGKTYLFEDSDRFGPNLVKRNGDMPVNPWPPERSAFWRAHLLWCHQGRLVAEDGITCIWHEPKPTTYYVERRGRQRWIVATDEGEPHGKEIFVDAQNR